MQEKTRILEIPIIDIQKKILLSKRERKKAKWRQLSGTSVLFFCFLFFLSGDDPQSQKTTTTLSGNRLG